MSWNKNIVYNAVKTLAQMSENLNLYNIYSSNSYTIYISDI